jgi:hypothetical protein
MKEIKQWRKATDDVARAFVKKYFRGYAHDASWFGEVGGVFEVAGMYFNIDRMITALENKATFDQLYDYYHAELEAAMAGRKLGINFENYIKFGWINEK